MDKYEYRLKTEHIKRLAARKDYTSAVKICDGIDWNKVKDVRMLTTVSDIYEAVGRYQEAIDVLIQAYQYAPIGRRIVYRLTELAVDCGNYQDAEEYYEEFCKVAPNDMSRILLKYKLDKAKGARTEELIKILEAYKEEDFDEKWSYELAELYAKAGRKDDCVQLCDDIILWFGLGKYVDKALRLKAKYAPLSEMQKQKLKDGQSFFEEEQDTAFVQPPDEEQEHFQAKLAQSVVSLTDAQEEPAVIGPDEEEESVHSGEPQQDKGEAAEYFAEDPAMMEEGQEEPADTVPAANGSEPSLAEELEEAFAQTLQGEEPGQTAAEISLESAAKEDLLSEGTKEDAGEASLSESPEESAGEVSLPEASEESAGEAPLSEISEESAGEASLPEALEESAGEVSLPESSEESVGEASLPESSEESAGEVSLPESPEESAGEASLPEASEESAGEASLSEVSEEGASEKLSAQEPEETAETASRAEESSSPKEQTPLFTEPGSVSVEEQIKELAALIENQGNLGDETGEVKAVPKEASQENVPVSDPQDQSGVWHFFVKSNDAEEGFRFAVDKLRSMMGDGKNRPSTIARTKGSKLNGKSIVNTLDKLLGKVVVVEQAGAMGKDVLDEFSMVLDKNDRSLIAVFIDTEQEIDRIIRENPKLAESFSAQFHARKYTVDDLMEYARAYVDGRDCAIDESARMYVTARIERILKEKPLAWRDRLENMLDEAVERGNKKSVGRALKGLFVIRYDDEGRLLLKEEDFK